MWYTQDLYDVFVSKSSVSNAFIKQMFEKSAFTENVLRAIFLGGKNNCKLTFILLFHVHFYQTHRLKQKTSIISILYQSVFPTILKSNKKNVLVVLMCWKVFPNRWFNLSPYHHINYLYSYIIIIFLKNNFVLQHDFRYRFGQSNSIADRLFNLTNWWLKI